MFDCTCNTQNSLLLNQHNGDDAPQDYIYFFFFHNAKPPVGQDLFIIEASPSHTNTPHSVGLLWTSDQPDAETYTSQHTTLPRDNIRAPGGIRTRNPSKRGAADPCLISANNIYNDINMWGTEEYHETVSFISCTPHDMGLFYDDQNKETEKDRAFIMHNRRKSHSNTS